MRIRSILVAAAVVASLAPHPAGAAKVCMWSIQTAMVDSVFSGNARAGTGFRFKVTQETVDDAGDKIPAGTMGYGVIRSASAAGRHNHDGMLSLEPRYLLVSKPGGGFTHLDVTMNPGLPVTWTPSEPLLNKAASHVPLPIPGLIMSGVNQVRWGRNITLGPGFAFTVLPVEDLSKVPVC